MMTFKQAVEGCDCSSVSTAYRKGLQGLKGEHRQKIKIADTRNLTGSLDLDAALKGTPKHCNKTRWDYGIGYKRPDQAKEYVVWVEVHPATSGEVKKMLLKLAWLKKWLKTECTKLGELPRPLGFVWLATEAGVNFTRGSSKAKLLAQYGLTFSGRSLDLDR